MTAMLSGVAVVGDLSDALDLVAAHPQLRAATVDGDLVGAGWVSGGSDRKPSMLELTSEIEKARAELAAAETQANELGAALAGALTEQAARQDAAEQALAALNESDAAISAIYEQLGRLGQDARTAEEEWVRLLRQREELETGRAQTVEELTELESRLRTAQQTQALSAATRRPAADRRRAQPVGNRPRRRGGSPPGGAHRRGTRQCRSRTGGFAAASRRRRA
ncbi:chromosome partition Smc domain protein [Mycobacterium xenopi 3993]|nr:chromosome partition Smc domain protein [Mycobacterium xenopi 3993]